VLKEEQSTDDEAVIDGRERWSRREKDRQARGGCSCPPDLQAASLAGADGQEAGRVKVSARFSLGGPTQEIWVGLVDFERTGDDQGVGHSTHALLPTALSSLGRRCTRGGAGQPG
jgi:hypothetical protein